MKFTYMTDKNWGGGGGFYWEKYGNNGSLFVVQGIRISSFIFSDSKRYIGVNSVSLEVNEDQTIIHAHCNKQSYGEKCENDR